MIGYTAVIINQRDDRRTAFPGTGLRPIITQFQVSSNKSVPSYKIFYSCRSIIPCTVETLVKFLVLLNKLAAKEGLSKQDRFSCQTLCTSYPQVISFIKSSRLLIAPRWFPQLAWICDDGMLCVVLAM
jgi:hypothetical protein